MAAGSVRGMLMAFERLGHPAAVLLAAAGLAASELDDPDARIACAQVGALFAAACSRRPMVNLALRLAQETPLGAYPLLDYLIVTSDTVGEGMRRYARHAVLTGAPMSVDLREDERPIRVVIETAVGTSEYPVALAVTHLRREAAGDLRAEQVSFTHAVEDRAGFAAALGCPVQDRATWNGFALSAQAWRLPFRRRDPALHEVLVRHAAEVVARIPGGEDTASELRRVLAGRVSGGDTRIGAVARVMGLSARTLQRHLAAAGTTYQEALDQSRCAAAERHLGDAALSIAEVSWLVGYSEPSAFNRAFKRWRGTTPQAFRHRHRAAP